MEPGELNTVLEWKTSTADGKFSGLKYSIANIWWF
jgi:hypothetical protein